MMNHRPWQLSTSLLLALSLLLIGGASGIARAQVRSQSIPGAPDRVYAKAAGPGAAYVFWSVPYSGSSPITQYVISAFVGAVPVAQKSVPATEGVNFSTEVTGLAAGTYTFTVTAVNSVGMGVPSRPTDRVVIAPAPAPAPAPGPPSIQLSGTTAAPGDTITVTGSGYPTPGQVVVTIVVRLTNGTSTTLSTTAATNSAGQFSATLTLPATVLAGTYTVGVQSQSTGQTVTQALKVNFPATYIIAVEGLDQSLWTTHGPGFVDLGGALRSAPAVVTLPNGDHLYIVTGVDHRLWVRSDTQGWQVLGPSYCWDAPAATVTNSTLTVACLGGGHALWTASTALPATGLPTVSGFTNLGGASNYGPAIAPVDGTLTYFVTGQDGRIWWRTLSSGWQPMASYCTSRPAAASNGTTTYLACRGGDGALWYATESEAGWSGFQSLGGQLSGGPGVAATTTEALFAVEGGDHRIYWNEVGSQGITSGWQTLGGAAEHGAAATAG
jgi:hypothetical protein